MSYSDAFPLAFIQPRLLAAPHWLGHIPFTAELIRRLRPTIIVELGTYTGSSLGAFCQAVEASGLNTICYGIDLWEGDIHMGRFKESMYEEVSRYFSTHHPETASLIRRRFDEAADLFEDGSVDLLHIDGTHTYEAVRKDFRTWHPKLSARSVVLFHDINVTRKMIGKQADQFGVRAFFDNLKEEGYTYLEFSHSYGLGVLFVGPERPEYVRDLINAARNADVLEFFASKGNELEKRGRRAALVRRVVNFAKRWRDRLMPSFYKRS